MLRIIQILEQKDGWVSIKLIQQELGINQTNINRRINQLHRFGLVEIIVDNSNRKRHLVKVMKKTEE